MGPRAKVLVPRLIRTLSSPPGISDDDWRRLRLVEFSAEMLGEMGEHGRRAIPVLERAAASYDDESSSGSVARRYCVWALEKLGADCDIFARLVRSEFGDTRKEALSILAKKCPELAHLGAMELLGDPQSDVRIKAVKILSDLGIGNSAPFEHPLDDTDVWVQLSAAKALTKHFPERLSQETVQSFVSNFQFQLQHVYTPHDTTRYLEAMRSHKEILKQRSSMTLRQ